MRDLPRGIRLCYALPRNSPMAYKELTIDFVLGRIIAVPTAAGPIAWRVLAFDGDRGPCGELRCCLVSDETVRTYLDWRTVRNMIGDGVVAVE